MLNFSLVLPDDFDEYALEVEAKGWFAEARMVVSDKSYRLNFFDPVRLNQEVEAEVLSRRVFFEPNLVIIKSVTKVEMQKALEVLVQSGQVSSFVSE